MGNSIIQLDTFLKAVVSIVTCLSVIYGWVVRPIRKMSQKIDALGEDVAYLQGDRLNSAHDFYCDRGWCPGAKKRELERWYNSYKAAGHNHLAENYIQDILSLPEKPTN